jgi:hypothetical protein
MGGAYHVLLDQPPLSRALGAGSPPTHLRPLEILHCALVLLRLSAGRESAKIAAFSSFRIDFP